MTRALCATAILLLASACRTTRADVLEENAALAAARAASNKDNLLGILATEPKAVRPAGGDVDRLGDRLMLHLRTGSQKAYLDKPECRDKDRESECQRYRLIVYARSRGVFVLVKAHFESAEYIVVDDVSGDEAILRGFPIFSPTGEHVLVLIINDEQLGFAVQIWRRSGHAFVLDWSGSPHADGNYISYELVRWDAEDTIELRSDTPGVPPAPRTTNRFSLRRTSGKWSVVDTP